MRILGLMADAVAPAPFPRFTVGDRMQKARLDCGIKSAERMAELLNPLLDPPVAPSTISAWERGANQPTRGRNRLDVVIPLWAKVCTEEARRLGIVRTVTAEWLYTGTESRATRSDKSEKGRHLQGLPAPKRLTKSASNQTPLLTASV